MKTCERCGIEKIPSQFRTNTRCASQLSVMCMKCERLARKGPLKKESYTVLNNSMCADFMRGVYAPPPDETPVATGGYLASKLAAHG